MQVAVIVLSAFFSGMLVMFLGGKAFENNRTAPAAAVQQGGFAPPAAVMGPTFALPAAVPVTLLNGQQTTIPAGSLALPTGQGLMVDYRNPATDSVEKILIVGPLPALAPVATPP